MFLSLLRPAAKKDDKKLLDFVCSCLSDLVERQLDWAGFFSLFSFSFSLFLFLSLSLLTPPSPGENIRLLGGIPIILRFLSSKYIGKVPPKVMSRLCGCLCQLCERSSGGQVEVESHRGVSLLCSLLGATMDLEVFIYGFILYLF